MPHQGANIIHITSETSEISEPYQWGIVNEEYTISTLLYTNVFSFIRDNYGSYMVSLFERLRNKNGFQTPWLTESTLGSSDFQVNINYQSEEYISADTDSTTINNSAGYCTVDINDIIKHSNQNLCMGGKDSDIKQRFTINFYEPNVKGATWQFLFNIDSKTGLVSEIDGLPITRFMLDGQENDFPSETWGADNAEPSIKDPTTKTLWLLEGPHKFTIESVVNKDREIGEWKFRRGSKDWELITRQSLIDIATRGASKLYSIPASFFIGLCSLYMLGGVYTDIRSTYPPISLRNLDSDVCLYLCMGEMSDAIPDKHERILQISVLNREIYQADGRQPWIVKAHPFDSWDWFHNKTAKATSFESELKIEASSVEFPRESGVYYTYKWFGSVTLPTSNGVEIILSNTVTFSLKSNGPARLYMWRTLNSSFLGLDSALVPYKKIDTSSSGFVEVEAEVDMIIGASYNFIVVYGSEDINKQFQFKYKINPGNSYNPNWISDITSVGLEFSTKWLYQDTQYLPGKSICQPGETPQVINIPLGLNYDLFYDDVGTPGYVRDFWRHTTTGHSTDGWDGYFNDSFTWFIDKVPKKTSIETVSVDRNGDAQFEEVRPGSDAPNDYFTYKWYGSVTLKASDSRIVGSEETVTFSLNSDDSSLLFIIPIDTAEPLSADSFLNSPHLIVDNSGPHHAITVEGSTIIITGTPYKILILYGNRWGGKNFSFKYRIATSNIFDDWTTDLISGELEFSTEWSYDNSLTSTNGPCKESPVCRERSIFTEFMVYNHKPHSPIILSFILRFLLNLDYGGAQTYPVIKSGNDFSTWGENLKHDLYNWLLYSFNNNPIIPEQKYRMNEVKIPIVVDPPKDNINLVKINLFYFPEYVKYNIRYINIFQVGEDIKFCSCGENTVHGIIHDIYIDSTYDIILPDGEIVRSVKGWNIQRFPENNITTIRNDQWYQERFKVDVNTNILTITKIKSDFNWTLPFKIDICLPTDEIIYIFKRYPISKSAIHLLEFTTKITTVNKINLPVDIYCKVLAKTPKCHKISNNTIYLIHQEDVNITKLRGWEQLNIGYTIVSMDYTYCICFLERYFNSYVAELFGRITLATYRHHFIGLCKLYILGGVFSDTSNPPFNIATGLVKDVSIYISLKYIEYDYISSCIINNSTPKNVLLLCFILWFLLTSSFIKRVNPNYNANSRYACADTNLEIAISNLTSAKFDIYNCIRYNLDNITIKTNHKYIITKVKIPVILDPREGEVHRVNLFYFPDNISYTCEARRIMRYGSGDSVDIYIPQSGSWEPGTIVSENFGDSYTVNLGGIHSDGVRYDYVRYDYIRNSTVITNTPSNWTTISNSSVIGTDSDVESIAGITTLEAAWSKVLEDDSIPQTNGLVNPIIMFEFNPTVASTMLVRRYSFFTNPQIAGFNTAIGYVQGVAQSLLDSGDGTGETVYTRVDHWGTLTSPPPGADLSLEFTISDNILTVYGKINHPIKIDICISAYETLYLFEDILNANVVNSVTRNEFTPYIINNKYIYINSNDYNPMYTTNSWRFLNPSYKVEYSFPIHCIDFIKQNFNSFLAYLFTRIGNDSYRKYMWGLCKIYITGGMFSNKRVTPMNLDGMYLDNGATFYTVLEPFDDHYISSFMLHNSKPYQPLIIGFLMWFILSTTHINGVTNEYDYNFIDTMYYDKYNCLRYNLNTDTILNGVIYTLTSVKIPITISATVGNSKSINLFYFPLYMNYTIELQGSPLFTELENVEVKLPGTENWVPAKITSINLGGTYNLTYGTPEIDIYDILGLNIRTLSEGSENIMNSTINIDNYTFDIQNNILTVTSIDGLGWDTFIVNICLATNEKICILDEVKFTTAVVPPAQESIDYMWAKSKIRNNTIYTTSIYPVPKYVYNSWSFLNSDFNIAVSSEEDCILFLKKNTNNYISSLFQRIKNQRCKYHLWSLCKLFIYSGVYADINSISRLHVNEVDIDVTVCLNTSSRDLTVTSISNNSEPNNPFILLLIVSYLVNKAYSGMDKTLYNVYECLKYSLNVDFLEINKKYYLDSVDIPVYIGPSASSKKIVNLFYFPKSVKYSIKLNNHIDGVIFDFTISNNELHMTRIDANEGWEYPYKIHICMLSSEIIYLI